MKKKVIFLVDMQSFYASVEQTDHPEWKGKPLIVSGDPDRRSGVVLAASPEAKKYGFQNAFRLGEAQQRCPQAIVVRPRMQRYLDVSMQITDILERFTDLVEPYSCDEQFMDVTGSQSLFGSPWEIARKVQKAIGDELGIYARVGIGSTKVIAKICCDNFAKKNKTGIYELTKEKMKTEMWKLPVGAMFKVGSRMENHLQRMGIRTIGQLANSSLEMLKRRWGINGHLLWMIANGIDYSPVVSNAQSGQKAIGHGMTLPKDYRTAKEIRTVLLELCEEVCYRARSNHVAGHTVSVGVSGADYNNPTGFHRQMTLQYPTNNTIEVFHTAWELFSCFWDRNPIRRIGISLSNLCSDREVQLNLFEDRTRKRAIGYTMDSIKNRFGKTAVMRAVSLTDAGQAVDRSMKIAGHYR